MRDSELIVLRTFGNRIEAEMASGVLEAAGIHSAVSADDAGGQYANLWQSGVRLLVRADDAAQAADVLDQDVRSAAGSGDQRP